MTTNAKRLNGRLKFFLWVFLWLFPWSAFWPFLSRTYAADKKPEEVIKLLKMPPGFSMSVYAPDLPDARSLTLGEGGVVFVGSRTDNKVYALVPESDFKSAKKIILASGLDTPNGVAFLKGDLYVALVNKILKFEKVMDQLKNLAKSPAKYTVIFDKLPSDTAHGWKFIAFGPDGKLYIPIGAPCNICKEAEGDLYATIHRLDLKTHQFELVAKGVRNTVGFDWHPDTKELWFTDNGRDLMGDDIPPDELNKVSKVPEHFGFPYCHAGAVLDPEFGKGHKCREFTPPVAKLDPHGAALGMRFYEAKQFPAEYRGNIFFAQHGSWNRSVPIGYRVLRAKLKGNEVAKVEPFIEGWLSPENGVIGRPVDVLVLPDGSLLISDDQQGVVYRVTYATKK